MDSELRENVAEVLGHHLERAVNRSFLLLVERLDQLVNRLEDRSVRCKSANRENQVANLLALIELGFAGL